MQGNASYQNATYMNAFKCISMQYHAAREECNRMECNENVENASECSKMHKNAYGKKPHHFREKTPLIPVHVAGVGASSAWKLRPQSTSTTMYRATTRVRILNVQCRIVAASSIECIGVKWRSLGCVNRYRVASSHKRVVTGVLCIPALSRLRAMTIL